MEEELEGDDDIDSKWIVPDVLPRGELIVIAAYSGVGKSLFTYSLAYASPWRHMAWGSGPQDGFP